VILYKLSRFELWVGRQFMVTKFITLVNLLAKEELFPEFLTSREDSVAMSQHVLRWLNEPQEHAALKSKLKGVREQYAQPGASDRAATYILEMLTKAESKQVAA